MDKIDLAKAIAGTAIDSSTINTTTKSTTPANITTTVSGVATTDSAAGSVSVLVDGETLELPTTFSVVTGDTVILSITNHTPVVTGVIGKGDSTDSAITEAQISADNAQATANYAQSTADAAQSEVASKMCHATCSTTTTTAAKVATVDAGTFVLASGCSLTVTMAESNTATAPTLNVDGTGAIAMMLNGAQYAYWVAGAVVMFVFDGTYWQVCNTPLYGITATIGNPGAGNIYIDSDSMDFRIADTTHATIGYDSSISSSFIKSDGKIHIQAGYGASAYLCASTSDGLPTDYGFGLVKTSTGYDAAIIADNVKINGDRVLAGWTQLKTWTNQSTVTYDDLAAAGYSEILLALYRAAAPELSSAVLPVALLTSTNRDVYMTGGYQTGTNGRTAALHVSLTSASYAAVLVDGVVYTSGLRWYLYAR